jgi:hypothetical protein
MGVGGLDMGMDMGGIGNAEMILDFNWVISLGWDTGVRVLEHGLVPGKMG